MTEALVITGLGVGVVFSGLILTSLLISSFTFFPNMVQRFKTPRQSQAVPVEKTAISPTADAETAAVIAVLLEVEYRLSLPLLEGRFTFRK
ncbi:MAG: OadG family protein [Candidatus Aminicenantes bacterium]|nr:OadG family protein [Candidatus Aminicenantes bacterium]